MQRKDAGNDGARSKEWKGSEESKETKEKEKDWKWDEKLDKGGKISYLTCVLKIFHQSHTIMRVTGFTDERIAIVRAISNKIIYKL